MSAIGTRTKITCPHCGKVGSTSQKIDVSRRFRCPDCDSSFSPGEGLAIQVTPPVVASIPSTKFCPYCGEVIQAIAVKCRHCSEVLDPRLRVANTVSPPQVIVNNTNINTVNGGSRHSPLVAALLSLICPGLGQLYKGQPVNAIAWFCLTVAGYAAFIVPGLVLHLCCVLGAASGNGR